MGDLLTINAWRKLATSFVLDCCPVPLEVNVLAWVIQVCVTPCCGLSLTVAPGPDCCPPLLLQSCCAAIGTCVVDI